MLYYELRDAHRQFGQPGLQLPFVHNLLRLHAALTDLSMAVQDNEGRTLPREGRLQRAVNVAGTLATFQTIWPRWREVDLETARIADMILADPTGRQQGVHYEDAYVQEPEVDLGE